MTVNHFAVWLVIFIAGLLLAFKYQRLGLFLAKHRLAFAWGCLMFFTVAFAAGCGPLTWLTDATNILPIAGGMLSGILALIGQLTGSALPTEIAGKVATIITDALKGIQDVQAIVAEYKQNPSTTLLTSIESGVKAVIDNINQFMTDTGITNPAAQSIIVKILTLFLTELTSFQTMLPALSASAGQRLTITVPMTTKASKAAYNSILSTPTGDTAVDAALLKLPRL